MSIRHSGSLSLLALFVTCSAGCSAPPAALSPTSAATSPYVAFARGEVDVDGGLIRIFALQAGRLATVKVRDGQRVQPGEVLAALETRSLRSNVAIVQAELRMVLAREGAARLKAQAARKWRDRLQEAQAADAAASQSVEEAELALAEAVAQEHIVRAEVGAASAKRSTVEQALADGKIRAPIGGLVVGSVPTPFLRVSADDAAPLFTLLPDRPRIVRAEVDEEFASAIHDGMAAEIVVGENPTVVIRARRVHVTAILRPRQHRVAGEDRVDGQVVDCILDVDAPALRVGQRVLVRFLRSG
jgi:multidrug resistance efflux pump